MQPWSSGFPALDDQAMSLLKDANVTQVAECAAAAAAAAAFAVINAAGENVQLQFQVSNSFGWWHEEVSESPIRSLKANGGSNFIANLLGRKVSGGQRMRERFRISANPGTFGASARTLLLFRFLKSGVFFVSSIIFNVEGTSTYLEPECFRYCFHCFRWRPDVPVLRKPVQRFPFFSPVSRTG
jgi:hypothetical protein